MSDIHAFIDETGTNALKFDKKDVSRYFICIATIVHEGALLTVHNSILELKQDLNMKANHELKSSKLKSERRTIALQKIEKLPIKFCAFVVDKKYLNPDSGLSYKKSFYKYINRVFYQHILMHTKNTNLIIHADKMGSPEFQEEFSSYLSQYTQQSLFDNSNWKHEFVDSKDSAIIQISDIVAGTLTKYIDKEFSNMAEKINYNIIQNSFIDILYFPNKILPNIAPTIKDQHIYDYQQHKCDKFFEEYGCYSEDKYKMKIKILELLINTTFNDSIIHSDKFVLYLKGLEFKINKRQFITDIIGNLREYGIIIVGTNKRYKLAKNSVDVEEYIKHDKGIIEPMLKKLLTAKNGLLDFSNTNLFFELTTLSKIIEVYEKEEKVNFRIE